MKIIEIKDVSDERVRAYASLTEAQLREGYDMGESIFIAESPKVIKTAMDNGYEPLSMLCERRHIEGDAAEILASCKKGMPVYTGERAVLEALTGYKLTRGVLCAMRRPEMPPIEDTVRGKSRICVLDGVVDSTNIGSIFRSAAALGVDAVVLSPQCCDPFNRRVVRVSMGTVFQVPWCFCDVPVKRLKELGFKTIALALRKESFYLGERELGHEPKLAAVFGSEGDGLAPEVIDSCDMVAKIPMYHGVDSLNVGAAAAVVFWEIRRRERQGVML